MPKSYSKKSKAAKVSSPRRTAPAHSPTRGASNKSSLGTQNFPVVGIGASAGGLEACRKLVEAMPADNGIAFILVQHLDPNHESMMVELLARHTSMTVRQATEGMPVERNHLYIIPPGSYLSVSNDALHLSQPQAHHGARLPFDFLLHSLANHYSQRTVCVILSGTGADGSLGLKTVKEKGGLVIVQEPDEAGYDGMPRSAIATDAVDLILPVAKIPEAIVKYGQGIAISGTGSAVQVAKPDRLTEIIALLRTKTAHDFTLYKTGTLRRRIERRMSMSSLGPDNMDRYLEILRSDKHELDLLANDLLINVTSFFRDPKVFDLLEKKIVPDLVRNHKSDQPLRIWIAGCSTGEETYSLAMLIQEHVKATKRDIKFQVFASDVDPDAITSARAGLYPKKIAADVLPERLARFFLKEEHGYRVSPELRGLVVFTVQDILADPPFSRIDLISCRNVLIYLGPEAQAKVISIFHFALREGGLLLLGNAETIGNVGDRFEVVAKPERLYRRIGRSRPGELHFSMSSGYGTRIATYLGHSQAPPRQAALAELCRRLVMESYAPAAVLINSKHECLYSLGPTDNYLRVAPGEPINDLLAMARDGVRTKLRSGIQRALQEHKRIVVSDGHVARSGNTLSFSITVQPVLSDGEELLLICFTEEQMPEHTKSPPISRANVKRNTELEQELEATKIELQGAIYNLELSSEEQKAINEEALSVNEEFQSANEELLTSKEELQSLNEELTALNSQLQETLERQRTTANDLKNVLYSTDVATLFLDTNLSIRFFTPATKLLFNIIPSDIGRPLADLHSLASDGALAADARDVLQNLIPIEREIETPGDIWFTRRILPYRTTDNRIEGVVITFNDITERKRVGKALEIARQEAELATLAKSRFLAAASHDLRQPLQTLSLLQGLLGKVVKGSAAQKLVERIELTLNVISGMLDTLLDINEIEAGTVVPQIVNFPINNLLTRLASEFAYHAQAQDLDLHVIPCSLFVHSDPRMIEQIVRNLLSNALKFTRQGKILLGCRRHKDHLTIEIWDTGIGIPDNELDAIFDEYHQIDNAERERGRGLGLGLSIVKRLSTLLGHPVSVRSRLGKGSVFIMEVALPSDVAVLHFDQYLDDPNPESTRKHTDRATILAIEDDPEVRELLQVLLNDEGHHAITAADGSEALRLVAQGIVTPELILADYNLTNGINGLQVVTKLREMLHRPIPGIILTGDISTETLRSIELQKCIKLNKPVKLRELTHAIQQLLQPLKSVPSQQAQKPIKAAISPALPVVIVVDDDKSLREGIRSTLENDGQSVEDYESAEAFLEAYRPGRDTCLLIDARLPGMSGFELMQHLNDSGYRQPAIMITGFGDVSMAVKAIKAGAFDFIEKPISHDELLASIKAAFEQSRDSSKLHARRDVAASHLVGLTSRQREIMNMVLAGHPSKNIAADLGISQRTVENHRASIMKKTGSKSLPELARLALSATWENAEESASSPPPP